MWKQNKIAVTAFCFAVSLLVSFSVCSPAHASVIYWGLPAIYSQGPGNFIAGSLGNMTARSYGAYAFTDYASSWGLNNPIGPAAGMGISGLNTWAQMYSLTPGYGYSSAIFNNPWMSTSFYPSYNLGYGFPGYSLFTPSYLPLTAYSPFNLGINTTPWTSSNLLLSLPASTAATTATTTATTP